MKTIPFRRGLCGRWLVGILAILALETGMPADEKRLTCDLDPLVDIPKVFGLTPAGLEALYPRPADAKQNPFIHWLTKTKDRAILTRRPFSNLTVDLSIFEGTVPVEEVVVDFVDGKLNAVTFSVYNRGDGGTIAREEFQRRYDRCDAELRRRLGTMPTPRRVDRAAGLLSSGGVWFSPAGLATLEKNPEADQLRPEYLKMRIAPRDTRGTVAAAIRGQSAGITLSQLQKNVETTGGRTVIRGVPMVDQGAKGYCVVATAQRLFEYYGISCDQHQLAKIARSDAESGTQSSDMIRALESLDQVFRLQFRTLYLRYTDGTLRDPHRPQKQADLRDFEKLIARYISDGIPILWGLDLGIFPEKPRLDRQTTGGHLRLIIGLDNENVYFTDSWGAGHELGSMKLSDAFQATHAILLMQPKLR